MCRAILRHGQRLHRGAMLAAHSLVLGERANLGLDHHFNGRLVRDCMGVRQNVGIT